MTTEVGTDTEVWQRLRRREPEALGDLFCRYAREVHAFAVRRTGSYATADDVVQAVFIAAWRQFLRGDPGPLEHSTARAWLFAIASNEIRNVSRARWRLTRLVARHPLPVPHDSDSADHADGVAARVDSERRIAEVRTALRKLPRHERETVELVYWTQLTMAEAAAVLGVAQGTVKARLSRARRRLPAYLTSPDDQKEQS